MCDCDCELPKRERWERIKREHAHELAEKIRNSEELRDATDDHMGDCLMAADLIDPEVPDGRRLEEDSDGS